jgi:TolB-like protein/Tfp pilus assembly protein PilF
MNEQSERRLAAIVMADVAGYTKLIQRDEAGTRALFNKLRKNFFVPLTKIHGGRIIKTNSVICAGELQKRMKLHIQDEPSLGLRSLQCRMAVNIGDIIVEGDDIHGEGVNVVARLQSFAEPGGVCLSDNVYKQVRGKLDARFEDGGRVTLKNIEGDHQIYLWSPEMPSADQAAASAPGNLEPASTTAARQAAIAVLPFQNMSGDPEQEFFSDGITEDIITELSRFRELHVKARNSSFYYKDQPILVQEVGQKLEVSYIVEGSVRRAGTKVRVTVQMVDVDSGGHVWAERYDRDLEDIFAVQDEITQSIVSVLPNRLRSALSDRVQRKSTENFSAYEYFLHGRWLYIAKAGADPRAITFLNKALEIDPKYAQAHAVLANLYAYSLFSLGVFYDDPEEKSRAYIGDAIKYGKNDPTIHTLVGEAYYWLGEFDRARYHIETALSLNPHDVQSKIVYGSVLNGSGSSEEGLRVMNEALEMDPHIADFSKEPKAECLYMLKRYEDALEIFLSFQDPPPHTHAQVAACYAHLGRMDDAQRAAERFHNVCADKVDFPRFAVYHARICQRPEDKENWLSGYRMVGLLEDLPAR